MWEESGTQEKEGDEKVPEVEEKEGKGEINFLIVSIFIQVREYGDYLVSCRN